MNKLIKKMFENRNISRADWLDMNKPTDGQLLDIDKACELLKYYRDSQKLIISYSDFDFDGINSGVMALAGLSELGFNVKSHLPNIGDGYGFKSSSIDVIKTTYPDVQAIITSDMGITCDEGILRGRQLGIDMIITDHHMQQNAVPASVIVNPCRLDENYEFPTICGATVMFKVLSRFTELYGTLEERESIKRLVVFAGMGTISDTMPLRRENRKIVKDCLTVFQYVCSLSEYDFNNTFAKDSCENYRNVFKGLRNIYKFYSGTRQHKIKSVDDLDAQFIAFYVSPMFNATKRMEGSLVTVYDVFFGKNSYLAIEELNELNMVRKALVADYMDLLTNTTNKLAPYVYICDAPKGVLGLIAQNMTSVTGLPCIVIRKDGNSYSGSARCPFDYPFQSMLRSEGFHAAGHECAFGIGFTDISEVKSYHALVDRFINELPTQSLDEMTDTKYDFTIATDGTGDVMLEIGEFYEYLEELKKYEPFGVGFEPPSIRLKFDPRDTDIEWDLLKGGIHLKATLPRNFPVLLFNVDYPDGVSPNDFVEWLKTLNCLEVSGKLSINEFRGDTSVNFIGKLI